MKFNLKDGIRMFRCLLFLVLLTSSTSPIADESEDLQLLKEFVKENSLTSSQLQAGKKAIIDAKKLIERLDALINESHDIKVKVSEVKVYDLKID